MKSLLLGIKYVFRFIDMYNYRSWINPFKPKFTIVIFIQYKPRIAVAILNF